MMFAVLEKSTGAVLHLFGEAPVITADGMTSPVRAADIRAATHEVVEADAPPMQFIPGLVTLINEQWATLDQGDYDSVLAALNPPPPLPELTMRQFRLGLLAAGLLDDVNAAIEALSEPDKSVAKIEFEFASTVVRNNQFIAIMAGALGLPDNQVDDLWRMAVFF